MTQNCPARQCRCCYFCREIGEALCCVKGPPALDETTGEARWPRVHPTDICGGFRCADFDPIATDHLPRSALPIYTDEYGDYCKIPLTQNRFAKVDPEDYIWLSQFRWCCKTGKDTCYAIRHIQDHGRTKRIHMHRHIQDHGRTKRIHMHRQIMDTPDNMICDHVNHDGLDNRKRNCRNCTIEQNNANRRSARGASSQYIGVSWCPRRKKWVSYIKHKGKARNLGLFDLETDAARAHDRAAWEIWGEYANLNFPDEYPGHPAAKPQGGP
jgi:hypothetical protein